MALERWVGEVKRATTPQKFFYRGELMLWDFSEQETWEKWDCLSDTDIGGYSNAHFGPNKKGTFTTNFNMEYFCNIFYQK